MKKKKSLLIINILYTLFSLILLGSTLAAGLGSIVLFVCILVFLVLSLIGFWLFYATDNQNPSILILKINHVLKYIFCIVCISAFALFIFAIQDCGAGLGDSKVTFGDRLKVLVVVVPIMVLLTVYFICTMRYLSKLKTGTISKKLSITFAIMNIIIGIGLLIDCVLSFVTRDSLLSMYIDNLSNPNPEMLYIVLFSISEVLYASIQIFKAVLVIKKSKE